MSSSPHPLTPAEAATVLDVSTRTLARWRASGAGPAWRKDGGRYLYPSDAVARWLERTRPGSMPSKDWDAYHASRAGSGHVLRWPDEEVVREAYAWLTVGVWDVLDVQCGAGRHTGFMASIGLRPIGIDISDVALVQASQLYPGVYFEPGDARALPTQAAGGFDAVLCWRSLHVFSEADAQLVVGELARVLRPSGRLLLSTRSERNVYRDRPEPMPREMGREDIYRLIQSAGFIEIEIDLSERTYGGGRYRDSWHVVRARKS